MLKSKPLLATNIDDLLIKHEAFSEPHKTVWAELIQKTGNKDLAQWIGKKDYFIGVNLAMDQLMPEATREEKTLQVRTWYQEAVIKYIRNNPHCIDRQIAKRLKQLKIRYQLVLLTSNTKKYISRILSSAGLSGLYDAVIASETEQEPKKADLVETLFTKYGKPEYYLTGKEDTETNEFFIKRKVKVITPKQIYSI